MAAKDYLKHYTRDTRALLIADTTNDLQQREIGYATAEHMLVIRDTTDGYHNFMEAAVVDSRSYASLAAAVAAIGLTAVTLLVTQAESVLDDLIVLDNIFLKVTGSGSINVAVGKTMTIGPFEAPSNLKVFTGTGSIVWRTASNFRVLQQWTGGNTGVDSWIILGKTTTNSTDSYYSWGFDDTDGSMKLSHAAVLGTNDLFSVTSAGLFAINGLTASLPVFTNASKQLVSNAMTGTGSVVMSVSPTLTGTIGAASMTLSGTLGVTGQATFTIAPIVSSLTASLPVFSNGSKSLVSNTMTGTGDVVMSASPTLTGTIGAANQTLSGSLGVTGQATFTIAPIVSSLTASLPVFSNGSKALISNTMTGTGSVVMSASPTLTGTVAIAAMTVSGLTASQAIFTDGSKGLVSNAITGSGNVVMSASPTLTGTIGAAALTLSSTIAVTGTSQFTGAVGIGLTPSTGSYLIIRNGTFGQTSAYGVDSAPLFTSGVTTLGGAGYYELRTAASSFTMTTGIGLQIGSPTKGSGSTITNAYGLKVEDQTAGGSNYAIKTGLGMVQFGDIMAFGGSPTSNVGFRLVPSLPGTVDAYGMVITPTFQASNTGICCGLYASFATTNSSYTTTTGIGIKIDSPGKGGSNTITTLYGLKIEDQTAGSTNYAIKTGAGSVWLGSIIGVGTGGVSSNNSLLIQGTISGLTGTDQVGLNSQPTMSSASTSSITGIYSLLNTASASFTVALGYGIRIANPSLGGASAITTNYGLKVEDQTAGGTNYAIYTGTGSVRLGGTLVAAGTSGAYDENSFTGTLTGCTTSPTDTFRWIRVGKKVSICAVNGLTATSNTTACTVTGMPASIRPSGNAIYGTCIVTDNGNHSLGSFSVNSSGTFTLYKTVFGSSFTTSGTKGIPVGVIFEYHLYSDT